jgi:hypothetical protein
MTKVSRLINPVVVIAAIGFAIILFASALLLLWLIRPTPTPKGPATGILNVIPLPSATQPLATALPVGTATSPSSTIPTPPPGVIAIGSYVQITGTGNDGLRVRSEPSLQGKVLFVAIEAEVFQVKDGPNQADGYIWWYLVAPYDEKHTGWAVSNYLAVIQNP